MANKLSDIAGAVARVALPAAGALAAEGDPRLGMMVGQAAANEFFPTFDQKQAREAAALQIENAKLSNVQKKFEIGAAAHEASMFADQQAKSKAEASMMQDRARISSELTDVNIDVAKSSARLALLKNEQDAINIYDNAYKDVHAGVFNQQSSQINNKLVELGELQPIGNKEYERLESFQKAVAVQSLNNMYGDELYKNMGKNLDEAARGNVNNVFARNNIPLYLQGTDGEVATFTKNGVETVKMTHEEFIAMANSYQDKAIHDARLVAVRQNAKSAGQRAFGRFAGEIAMRTGDEAGANKLATTVVNSMGVYRQHAWGLALTWKELMAAHGDSNPALAARLIDEAADLLQFEGDITIDPAQDAEGNVNPPRMTVSITAGSSTAKDLGLPDSAAVGGFHRLSAQEFHDLATKDINEEMDAHIAKFDRINADPIKDMPKHVLDDYATSFYQDYGTGEFYRSYDAFRVWHKNTTGEELDYNEPELGSEAPPSFNFGSEKNHAAWRAYKIWKSASDKAELWSDDAGDDTRPILGPTNDLTSGPASTAEGVAELFDNSAPVDVGRKGTLADVAYGTATTELSISGAEIDKLKAFALRTDISEKERRKALNRINAYEKFNEQNDPSLKSAMKLKKPRRTAR